MTCNVERLAVESRMCRRAQCRPRLTVVLVTGLDNGNRDAVSTTVEQIRTVNTSRVESKIKRDAIDSTGSCKVLPNPVSRHRHLGMECGCCTSTHHMRKHSSSGFSVRKVDCHMSYSTDTGSRDEGELSSIEEICLVFTIPCVIQVVVYLLRCLHDHGYLAVYRLSIVMSLC